MKWNYKRRLSIFAALLSATAWLYSSIAPTWGLPFGEEVFTTGSKIVLAISMLLGALTGDKIASEGLNIPDNLTSSDNNTSEDLSRPSGATLQDDLLDSEVTPEKGAELVEQSHAISLEGTLLDTDIPTIVGRHAK